jgi:hypothetical protein
MAMTLITFMILVIFMARLTMMMALMCKNSKTMAMISDMIFRTTVTATFVWAYEVFNILI